MAKKKKGGIIKLLFVLIFITCVIIVATLSWKSGRDTIHGEFNNEKKAAAQVLYSEITNVDIEKVYPKTPDEVMQFYGKCYRLLYGDMINDEEVFAKVLHIQRKLYSDELANKNLFENQLQKIKEDVSKLKESEVFVLDFDTKPPIYDKNYQTCDVRTVISTNANNENGVLKAYMVFNIIKDENDCWKIHSFRNTNEEFE